MVDTCALEINELLLLLLLLLKYHMLAKQNRNDCKNWKSSQRLVIGSMLSAFRTGGDNPV